MRQYLPLVLLLAVIGLTAGQSRPASDPEPICQADSAPSDKDFDASLDIADEPYPKGAPPKELQKELQQSDLKGTELDGKSAEEVTRLASINPYVAFQTGDLWFTAQRPCCPFNSTTESHPCRPRYSYQPCFRHGTNQVCCPYPANLVRIASCACSKCSTTRGDCFFQGRCLRRYHPVRFTAICFSYNTLPWWVTFRRITKWLPRSCYCNTRFTC